LKKHFRNKTPGRTSHGDMSGGGEKGLVIKSIMFRHGRGSVVVWEWKAANGTGSLLCIENITADKVAG